MEVLRPSEKRSRLAYFSSLSDEKLLSVAVDSVWLCQRIPSTAVSANSTRRRPWIHFIIVPWHVAVCHHHHTICCPRRFASCHPLQYTSSSDPRLSTDIYRDCASTIHTIRVRTTVLARFCFSLPRELDISERSRERSQVARGGALL